MENVDAVLERLDKAIGLLALLATRELTQRDSIAALARLGFQPRDIANLLGTTSNTVRVALVQIRKSRSKR